MFKDKNEKTIRQGNMILLDCCECECIDSDDILECSVRYESADTLVCTDSRGREYRFRDSGKILFCMEVIDGY